MQYFLFFRPKDANEGFSEKFVRLLGIGTFCGTISCMIAYPFDSMALVMNQRPTLRDWF